jgi:hypothetical protein
MSLVSFSNKLIVTDVLSSVSLFEIPNGQIQRVSKDYSPKQLKYAFAIDKLIFAYGKEKLYALSMNQDSIETLDSFNSDILSVSQLNHSPITYSTKSGSIGVLFEIDEEYKKMFESLISHCCDWAGNKIKKSKGYFVDGDLIIKFLSFDGAFQRQITSDVDKFIQLAESLSEKIQKYRFENQLLFSI